MKRNSVTVYLLIVILAIFAAPAFTQDTSGIPILALKEREFNFGKVKEASRITHAFTVQNKGTVTLEIKKISSG